MARSSKHGRKKNKNSHLRYISQDHRTTNKMRRIMRFNGEKFLAVWQKDLPTWKARHRVTVK